MISFCEKGHSKNLDDYNQLKVEQITDNFWRPKEIAEKIDDATTRQLADLAERGIITPAVETSGAGTSRLYNHTGIYSIMIAVGLRKVLSPALLKDTIDTILKYEKDSKPFKPELVVIHPFFDKNAQSENDVHLTFFYQKNDPALWDTIRFFSAEPNAKSYLANIILLRDIKEFLRRTFK